MKHFGNCAPEEFLAQAIRFRGPFRRWLKAVGAREIRRRTLGAVGAGASEAERVAAHRAFLGELINASMERCPELTREALCLATFTLPEAFEARPMADYLAAAVEMYESRAIRDFFTLSLSPETTTSSGA